MNGNKLLSLIIVTLLLTVFCTGLITPTSAARSTSSEATSPSSSPLPLSSLGQTANGSSVSAPLVAGSTPPSTPAYGSATVGSAYMPPPKDHKPRSLPESESKGQTKADPYLISQLNQKLLRWKLQAQGKSDAEINKALKTAQPTAPHGSSYMPTKGVDWLVTICIDFPDYPHTVYQTTADVQSKMYGSGIAGNAPYESLHNYYARSSLNQLSIVGDTYGWYRALHDREYYNKAGGREELVQEAVAALDPTVDFSKYDNNKDGYIDGFFIKWTGPDNGWANFWWAWQLSYQGSLVADGVQFGGRPNFVWSWVTEQGLMTYRPNTDIHETGHLLGLPDLYDYDDTVGPRGGVGGLDMMDGGSQDHNAFSKLLLDWITTPTVIATDGILTRVLQPSGPTGDCVIIMPMNSFNPDTPYNEFFIAEYRQPLKSNDDLGWPGNGVIIWHIDATLNPSTGNFLYDNSYTAHKLVRLMEADGLEEIEQGMAADRGDPYNTPKLLGPSTVPNSNNYAGGTTDVTITPLTYNPDAQQVEFKLGNLLEPTAFTIATTTTTPNVNAPFTLSGTLKSGTTPLTQPVHLERRSYGNGAWGGWVDVASSFKSTDGAGKVSLAQTVATAGTYQYRWHFAGTATYQAAYSSALTETVKKPTSFSIATTTATPTTNIAFTLTGSLKSGTTALISQPVHLERRALSGSTWGAWANVANTYKYTDGTGTIKLAQTIATAGSYQYRWHYNGTATYQPAYSNALGVTVKKPTSFTISTTAATPTTNIAFTLTGSLKSGTTALISQPVHLERRTYANGAWGGWANVANTYKYTDGTGTIKLAQTIATAGSYQYRWHYNGTAAYQPAYSSALTETVKKPTAMTITTSPATPVFNKAFTLSGTLKTGTTGVSGLSVHLERKVGTGAWAGVTGITKTTGSGGVIPAVSQIMTTHTTYSYRWHFAGTGTYQPSYSSVKTIKV